MLANELFLKLALVAGQAAMLFLLSRALFVWVLQALASRKPRRGGGWVLQLVRLPGNLVHELSHAVAFLLAGYRIRRLVPCIFDRAGAGACQPGPRWSPLAIPWLAVGLAALAPLVSGALVLYAAARWLDIPLGATLSSEVPHRSILEGLYRGLGALDYGSWHTWLFLYLAFTIGAELAPSSTDVRLGLPTLLALGVLTAAVLVATSQLPPTSPFRVTMLRETTAGLAWLDRLFSFALVATGVVTALTFLPAALLRTARGQG